MRGTGLVCTRIPESSETYIASPPHHDCAPTDGSGPSVFDPTFSSISFSGRYKLLFRQPPSYSRLRSGSPRHSSLTMSSVMAERARLSQHHGVEELICLGQTHAKAQRRSFIKDGKKSPSRGAMSTISNTMFLIGLLLRRLFDLTFFFFYSLVFLCRSL